MEIDADRMAKMVVAAIETATAPLLARIQVLEQQKSYVPRDGRDGAIGMQGEKGSDGRDGKDGEPGQPGRDGKDGVDGKDGAQGQDGRDGVDGKSIDPEAVEAWIAAHVEKAIARLPIPKDGAQGPAGPQGEKGMDGRDGLPGQPGRDGERGPIGEKGLDGRDGKDGINGRDGVLENLKVERIDERTHQLCFKDGTPVEGGLLKFGHPVFREVFTTARTYEAGDVVQRDGSGWIALVDNPPGTPGVGKPEVTGWKLFIKRGDVGKQGPMGPEGQQGKAGPMGPQGKPGY
jgi:hypothetical protein